jgi:hypothetical protein
MISQAELARVAGVSKQAISKLFKPGGTLCDAKRDGKVDPQHPLVVEYLATKGVHYLPKTATNAEKPATNRAPPDGLDALPAHMDGLEDLTVRQIVTTHGSIDGFKRFVEIAKKIADLRLQEIKIARERGELVDRALVKRTIFALLDVATSRLVSDVPTTATKLVMARAESGGPEAQADIEAIIRKQNSQVIKNAKTDVLRAEVLADG